MGLEKTSISRSWHYGDGFFMSQNFEENIFSIEYNNDSVDLQSLESFNQAIDSLNGFLEEAVEALPDFLCASNYSQYAFDSLKHELSN